MHRVLGVAVMLAAAATPVRADAPAEWPAAPKSEIPLPRMAPERSAPRFSSLWLGVRIGTLSYGGHYLGRYEAHEVMGSTKSFALDVGRRWGRHTTAYATFGHDVADGGAPLQGASSSIASDFIGIATRASPKALGRVGTPDWLRFFFEFRGGGRRLRISRDGQALDQKMASLGASFGIEWRISVLAAASLTYYSDLLLYKWSPAGRIVFADNAVADASNTSTDAVSGGVSGFMLAVHFDLWRH